MQEGVIETCFVCIGKMCIGIVYMCIDVIMVVAVNM